MFSLKNVRTISVVLSTIVLLIYLYIINNPNEDLYIEVMENGNMQSTTEEKSHRLFDVDFNYILNNRTVCTRNTRVIIIVTSYFGNMETRSAMRRAFSQNDLQQMKFSRIFLLGISLTDRYITQKGVEIESKRFGDLVQGNFIEAYKNLTYKHIMGLKWVHENCLSAEYVIKMDDDIVVNIERIPNILSNLPSTGNFIAGYILKNMIPIREPTNKWFVTRREYGLNDYPPFVSGWFYITLPKIAKQLYELSQISPYFWIDDTYVTGILAEKLNIAHHDIGRYFTVHSEFLDCCISDIRTKNLFCDIVIGPNGGNNNLFYDFNNAIGICNLNLCRNRTVSLNDTCVAVKKQNLAKGNAIIENYKL